MKVRAFWLVAIAVLMSAAAGFIAGRYSLRVTSTSATKPSNFLEPVQKPRHLEREAQKDSPPDTAFSALEFEVRLRDAIASPMRQRLETLEKIARSVSAEDASAALEVADRVLFSEELETFRSALLTVWSATDPTAALEYAQGMKESKARQRAIDSVLRGWARNDPQSALNYASALADDRERTTAMNIVGAIWASQDPKAVLDAIPQIPDALFRQDMAKSILWNMAQSSPKVASEYFLRLSVSDTGLAQFLAREWAAKDLNAALAWVKGLPDGVARDAALEGISISWIKNDPKGAIEFANSLPEGRSRDRTIGQFVRALGARDFETAAKLVGNISDETTRRRTLNQIILDFGLSDPASAVQFAARFPGSQDRIPILSRIAGTWALKDPQAALAWVQTLPEGEVRSEMLSVTLGNWAALSPDEAISRLLQLSGEEQTRSVGAVVQTMAQRDPARASAWVDQFPGGEARDRAMEALVKGWSQRDPEAASAWLAEQPSGTGKDLATKQFIEQASFIKPDVAWKLATAITDPWLQAAAIDKAAQMWMTKDPKTARAAIQSSSLPAAQKAALLKLY